jgi:hypothetical protein
VLPLDPRCLPWFSFSPPLDASAHSFDCEGDIGFGRGALGISGNERPPGWQIRPLLGSDIPGNSHGFTHGSVTVLVTVQGLPQSHSITLTLGWAITRGISKGKWYSIPLNHTWSSGGGLGLWIWLPRFDSWSASHSLLAFLSKLADEKIYSKSQLALIKK